MGESRMATCARGTLARRPSGTMPTVCVLFYLYPLAHAEQVPASGSPRAGARRKVDSLGGRCR